jgi:alpha-beta hydrolase superfamily lysophospholipase
MTELRELLPFERRFKAWMLERGMRWREEELHCGEQWPAASYRLQPAGEVKRVVCAFHGAGNDALFGWVGLFKRLLGGGVEIFTFDLPGHGRGCSTSFSRRSVAAAIGIAVKAARREGVPLHAVGVSLGGSVLLSQLPAVQHDLTSVALVVAPLQIALSRKSITNEIGVAGLRLIWREREHYGLSGLIPSFGPFKRSTYPLRLATTPPSGAFGYVEALNSELRDMELVTAAGASKLPTLLIYGERDLVVPAEQGEQLAGAMSNARLERIIGGTHLTTPLDPKAVDLLVSWLEVGR